ncbi:MAG: DMT family transporter [Myxococcales bacterium]|jgi:transporter family protein
MGWFGSALLATLLYGFMQAIQKLAASRGLSPMRLVFAAGLVVSLLAGGAMVATGAPVGWSGPTLVYAGLNSLFFTTGSALLLRALKRASAAVALPVNKLDAVLVVAIGALAFGERPTPIQWLGVLFGLAVVVVLTGPERGGEQGSKSRADLAGVALAAGAALCFAGSMTVGRLAARAGPVLPFVASTYACTALLALGASRLVGSDRAGSRLDAWRYGAAIGVLNFAGYLLILRAFAQGPMALIQPLFASSMLVAVGLSAWALRERIAWRHALAVGLSLGAALLIRIG